MQEQDDPNRPSLTEAEAWSPSRVLRPVHRRRGIGPYREDLLKVTPMLLVFAAAALILRYDEIAAYGLYAAIGVFAIAFLHPRRPVPRNTRRNG